MNRAVSSSVGSYMQPGAQENIAYLTHTKHWKDFQYKAMVQQKIGTDSGSVPMNFKDMI